MATRRNRIGGAAFPLKWRIAAKIERGENGCWLWIGAKGGGGYGHIRVDGQVVTAHRAVYELERGPIPHGLSLDHLCRNILCVNPDHLEPVTHQENVRRGRLGEVTRERHRRRRRERVASA